MPRLTMTALVLGALVAACAPAPSPSVASFRAAGTPIWSSAAFQPARLEGDWRQVADMTAGQGSCAAGSLTFAPAASGLTVRGDLCLNGRRIAVSGPVRPVGPGRLEVPGMEPWWILWVDEGYRTLAIGTPSGRFGLVLDRGAIAPDRLTAAREVMGFNGYAEGRLRPF